MGCPSTLPLGIYLGLPASGSCAGLRLCRGGKQRVVFLLEGKVLESPHGQGCGQALPGESRGEAGGEEEGAGRSAIREVGFQGGPVGTCQSAIQTPPLEVLVTNHSLLLCKPRPRGKWMSRCPQKEEEIWPGWAQEGSRGGWLQHGLTGVASAGAYIQRRRASPRRRPRTAQRHGREGVVGGEGRPLGTGERSPYDPRHLQEGDGRKKKC